MTGSRHRLAFLRIERRWSNNFWRQQSARFSAGLIRGGDQCPLVLHDRDRIELGVQRDRWDARRTVRLRRCVGLTSGLRISPDPFPLTDLGEVLLGGAGLLLVDLVPLGHGDPSEVVGPLVRGDVATHLLLDGEPLNGGACQHNSETLGDRRSLAADPSPTVS